MKPESGIITEDAFEAWGPRLDPDGDYLDFEDVQHKPLHRVWTVVEGDGPWGHLYAMPGFHVVNVVGYLTTKRPWTDETQVAYWFFDTRTAYTAVLDDGKEVDEVGVDEDDARERIESCWDQKVVSIRLHDEEEAS